MTSIWLSNLRSWTGLALTVVEVLQSVTDGSEVENATEKLCKIYLLWRKEILIIFCIALKDIYEGKIDKGKITATVKDIGEVPSKKDLKDGFVQKLRRGIFAVYTVLQAGGVAVLIYEKLNDPTFVKNPTPKSIAPVSPQVYF